MIDYPNLLQTLHINELNERSSIDDIDVVFKALGYSTEDKNQAIQSLKTNGWLMAPAIPEPKVEVNEIPETQPISTPIIDIDPGTLAKVPPAAPVEQVLNSPPKKIAKTIMILIIIFIILAGIVLGFAYVENI